jgi:hypothetical protein
MYFHLRKGIVLHLFHIFVLRQILLVFVFCSVCKYEGSTQYGDVAAGNINEYE